MLKMLRRKRIDSKPETFFIETKAGVDLCVDFDKEEECFEKLDDDGGVQDEKILENFVFGGEDDAEDEIDRFVEKSKRTKKQKTEKIKTPRWEDPDDDAFMTRKSSAAPSWASKKRKESHSDDDNYENADADDQTGKYLSSDKRLRKQEISIKRCTDINETCPSQGKIRSVEFSRSKSVALVGGADTRLKLFSIDGKENSKIFESKAIENSPIFSAHFTVDESSILIGSQRHKSIYCFDMMTGDIREHRIKGIDYLKNTKSFTMSPDGKYFALLGESGFIHVLSAKSIEPIESLKVEGDSVEAVAFTHDGTRLLSHGGDGVVNVYDMRQMPRRCLHRFVDEGCIKGTSLAVSPNDRHIVTGSDDGTVNIYDESCLDPTKNRSGLDIARPKPRKTISNLTSSCTNAAFNPTGEILAISSSTLKLVHVESMSVFSNFPNKSDSVYIPYSLGFSPRSGYMTVGNNKGQALLYRLEHYSDY